MERINFSTFHLVKYKMKCPVCQSDKIVTEIGGLMEEFLCKKCDYRGEITFEEDLEEQTSLN